MTDRQPPRFKIGDKVDFINDYGVEFKDKTITGIEYWDGYPTPRYFFTPSGNPNHYSSKECNFRFVVEPTREQMQARKDELDAYFDAHNKYEGNECNAECWREYAVLQQALNKPA